MNGRMHDPRIARFIQADPMIQDPMNSQSLNRYSYVMNNPLNATDPTGMMSQGSGGFSSWLNETGNFLNAFFRPQQTVATYTNVKQAPSGAVANSFSNTALGITNNYLLGVSESSVNRIGGFGQMTLGAVGTVAAVSAAGTTGCGGVVGCGLLIAGGAMSADQFQVGLHRLATGQNIASGVQTGLEMAGVSPAYSPYVETGLGLSVGSAQAGRMAVAMYAAKASGSPLRTGKLIGSMDELSNAEKMYVNELVQGGRTVMVVPRSNSSRSADFVIDGTLYELKTLSNVKTLTSDRLSASLSSTIMNARGQSANIIVDARAQAGMTSEIAARGISRAFGADAKTGSKIQEISVITEQGTIYVPRMPK